MLKVTKSANKSVLDDAINTEHTAVTMQGPDQPDQDDYGYVSTEANAFYQKYIEKVKRSVKTDTSRFWGSPLSCPKSIHVHLGFVLCICSFNFLILWHKIFFLNTPDMRLTIIYLRLL